VTITLLAIGSRGDVQPLVALGVGLLRRDRRVRLVAGDEFEGLVRGAGLEFVPLGLEMQPAMEAQTDLFRFMASIRDNVLRASQGEHDAIVATFLGVSACPLARANKIPFFYALPIPGLRTREFPHPLFRPLALGKVYNAFTYRLADRRATRAYEDARCLFAEPRPTYLFCFSPHVVPRPGDWGPYAHVTGYWFLDHPAGWQPPADLEAFLRAGPPPVYVGFGSMPVGEAQRLTAIALEALAVAGQRGVLGAEWGGLESGEISPDLYLVSGMPHDWLFPRLAAAVHHGGAGTTAAALRAGIPSVIVPFGLDQPFWARRLQALGAGTPPIASKELATQPLAAAIRQAVEDPRLRANAARLSKLIRAEDGVGNAVAIIERVLAR